MKRRAKLVIIGSAVLLLAVPISLFYEVIEIFVLNIPRITRFTVRDTDLIINGTLNTRSYDQLVEQYEAHPQITRVVQEIVDGSVDDEVTLRMGYFVRDNGLHTHLMSYSQIDSGAVDLFTAGVERSMERGAHIGVHAWSDGIREATDFPLDSDVHTLYAEYFDYMLGSDDFYWFTINAAPADDIHEMTNDDIATYGLLTQPQQEPSTNRALGIDSE